MRLNKKLQLGLLLTLYLSRSGKTTIESAAKGLKVSQPFLEQVARDLRLSGVIRSIRGAGGGYELVGEPLVADVFKALSPVTLLPKNAPSSTYEQRTLNYMAFNLTEALSPTLNRKVKNLGASFL